MPVRRSRKGKQGTGAKQSAITSASATLPPPYAAVTAAFTTTSITTTQQQQQHQPTQFNTSVTTCINHDNNITDDTNKYEQLILTSDKRRGVYECDYCGCDVSQTPRIRCATCIDFDVCCDCFITTDPQTAIARLQTQQQQQHAVSLQSQSTMMPSASDPGATNKSSSSVSTSTFVPPPPPQHDPLTHGYRVCDSTRYPLFPINAAVAASSTVAGSGMSSSTGTTGSGGGGSGNIYSTTTKTTPSRKKKMKTTFDAAVVVSEAVATTNDEMVIDSSDDYNTTMEGIDLFNRTDNPETTVKVNLYAEQDGIGGKRIDDAKMTAVIEPMIIMSAGDDNKMIWTVEEDLRLLHGIQTHGLGNWTEISEAVVGHGSQGKTPKRCMERYFDDYMGRYGYILPPYTLIGEATTTPTTTSNATTTNHPDTDDDVEPMLSNVVDGDGRDSANNNTSTTAPTTTTTESAVRTSKRRSTMLRTPGSSGGNSSLPVTKKYIAVPTESLPEYQHIQLKPFLPKLQSGVVTLGQEVGRDQASKAELAYVRAISGLDSKEQVERIRSEWEMNRLNKPGGPTVLPMRPDDVPKLPGSELSGFMQRRGDFDIEYDNNAEEAIADMEFVPGESEQDRILKLAVLAIYKSNLDERTKRKQFIISRKLYDYKTYQEDYRKLPRDERDLVLRMRLFERFHTPEEHKVFIADLLRAKRLRKEIARLQMYRRIGIRTQLEAERYEIDKARRLFHKNTVTQKLDELNKAEDSSSNGVAATGVTAGTIRKLSSSNVTDINHEADASQYWKQYRTTDRKVRRSINRGVSYDSGNRTLQQSSDVAIETSTDNNILYGTATPSESIAPTPSTETLTDKGIDEATQNLAETNDAMDVEYSIPELVNKSIGITEPTVEEEQGDEHQPNKDHQNHKDDDIVHLPGYNQLSSREVDLIRSIQITPQQYLQIKKVLIYESLQHGLLEENNDDEKLDGTNDTRRRRNSLSTSGFTKTSTNVGAALSNTNRNTIFLLDIERRGTVVDFILHAGWITTQYGKSVLLQH